MPGGVSACDDTGFAQPGKPSLGVARPSSGTLGQVAHCPVTVNGTSAERTRAGPMATRWYLPPEGANDPVHRPRTPLPAEVRLQTQAEIALDLWDQANAWAGWGVIPSLAILPVFGMVGKPDANARTPPFAHTFKGRSRETPRPLRNGPTTSWRPKRRDGGKPSIGRMGVALGAKHAPAPYAVGAWLLKGGGGWVGGADNVRRVGTPATPNSSGAT